MQKSFIHHVFAVVCGSALLAGVAGAAVTPPAGYIYSTQLLGNLTQSCVAAGPGGTFVGIGPGFTANANAIVFAKESGDLRLVATGFNSIGGCAYDAAADMLYVTDNADNGDFGITSGATYAAQSGDTVFAIPSASTAAGLSAPGHELVPRDSIPYAASVAVDASGNVFVSNSAGSGSGSVLKISGGSPSTFVSGFDYMSGLAFNPANGNLFAAQFLSADFSNEIDQFTPAGTPVPPVPFAPSSYTFGSYGLAFNSDGQLLASGVFDGNVVSFDTSDGSSTTFVSGLTDAGGMTVDPFTHRVQILSSTFTGGAEDKSLHRFTPINQLTSGGISAKTSECLHEAYGLHLVNGIATCTDGAPCDSDGKVNGACLFPVGFCLNVNDPNFPTCSTASNVADVKISSTTPSAAIAAAATQVASALPLSGSSCFFSDGYYVPVKVLASGMKRSGRGTVTVRVTAADGRKDTDTLRMVCRPAP